MTKQKMYLEHVNITVNNLQESIKFFQTAFPHFKIRGGGSELREWVHLGDDETYLALNQAQHIPAKVEKNYDKAGINHIGFVVQDVEEIANNLLNNGYERDYPKEIEQFRIRDYPKAIEQFRIRDYFADNDGNQYEFIQYLSEKAEERNSY